MYTLYYDNNEYHKLPEDVGRSTTIVLKILSPTNEIDGEPFTNWILFQS